jgi:hypothetical protein
MKKQLFSFVMMLALVIVAGSAFAQPAKYTPVVGSQWTYTVGGLNNGDAVAFSLNQITTAPGGTAGGTMSLASTVVASNSASVTINWTGTPGIYNLWIVVTGQGAGTCSNQRYVPVTLSANNFNATIIALGTNTASEYPSWNTATSKATDCPVFSKDANFLSTSGNDGKSYVFYKVSKIADNNGTWDFSVASSISGGTVEYYDGSSWSTTAPTNLPDATTAVLVRITIANIPAGQSLIGTVTAIEHGGGVNISDNTPGDNGATIGINAMPDLSGISFN